MAISVWLVPIDISVFVNEWKIIYQRIIGAESEWNNWLLHAHVLKRVPMKVETIFIKLIHFSFFFYYISFVEVLVRNNKIDVCMPEQWNTLGWHEPGNGEMKG